ncbi:MAG: hypothetical protein ACLRZ2_01135 [Veillonella sp.]
MNCVLTQPGLQGVNALRNKRVHFNRCRIVWYSFIRWYRSYRMGCIQSISEGVPDLIH